MLLLKLVEIVENKLKRKGLGDTKSFSNIV